MCKTQHFGYRSPKSRGSSLVFNGQERGLRGRGFTLLEISVVLALMAMMSSVVVVSMNRRLRGAHQEQVIQSLRALDHRARHDARAGSHPISLQFDAQAGIVRVITLRSGVETVVDEYKMPTGNGWRLDQIWILVDGRRIERTTLTLPVDHHGISATYGFTLVSHSDSGDHKTSNTSLLVAGVSGQFTVFEHEEQVQNILAELARHDAD